MVTHLSRVCVISCLCVCVCVLFFKMISPLRSLCVLYVYRVFVCVSLLLCVSLCFISMNTSIYLWYFTISHVEAHRECSERWWFGRHGVSSCSIRMQILRVFFSLWFKKRSFFMTVNHRWIRVQCIECHCSRFHEKSFCFLWFLKILFYHLFPPMRFELGISLHQVGRCSCLGEFANFPPIFSGWNIRISAWELAVGCRKFSHFHQYLSRIGDWCFLLDGAIWNQLPFWCVGRTTMQPESSHLCARVMRDGPSPMKTAPKVMSNLSNLSRSNVAKYKFIISILSISIYLPGFVLWKPLHVSCNSLLMSKQSQPPLPKHSPPKNQGLKSSSEPSFMMYWYELLTKTSYMTCILRIIKIFVGSGGR